jgi:hypothetical protein
MLRLSKSKDKAIASSVTAKILSMVSKPSHTGFCASEPFNPRVQAEV